MPTTASGSGAEGPAVSDREPEVPAIAVGSLLTGVAGSESAGETALPQSMSSSYEELYV
jgi:hypothetical protein